MKQLLKTIVSIMLLFIASLIPLCAEQLQSSYWGYTLDLPEGFVLSSQQGSSHFQFDHSLVPVSLLIASYEKERYTTAKQALTASYKSLNVQGETHSVRWRNNDNEVGSFLMQHGGVDYAGWAVSVVLPEEKGVTVCIAYAPKNVFSQYESIIVSALDSIGIDRGSHFEAGILTRYEFENEGDITITTEINGITVEGVMDKVDVKASEYVIQREYDILVFFSQTDYWQEAWQRFYRIVYRDSYKRLERFSFSLYNALYLDLEKNDPENFDTNLTQILLTWVQNFEYLRIPLGTDFVSLNAIIAGKGSDCDSRALLLAVIMNQMRYDTMLFVSREYSHAFFGIAIEGPGARLSHNGTSYLLGETTAPVALGLVPQEFSEISKWIGINGL